MNKSKVINRPSGKSLKNRGHCALTVTNTVNLTADKRGDHRREEAPYLGTSLPRQEFEGGISGAGDKEYLVLYFFSLPLFPSPLLLFLPCNGLHYAMLK